VKTLERNRIDEIVRELESGAYRLALERGVEPPSAERILLEAFGSLAPSLPKTARIVELREKLHACIRRRLPRQEWVLATPAPPSGTSATVSESLHLRIVDLLEEHQADEPVGRRRAMLVGLIGVALVGALIAFVKVHADALAAAQPIIEELSPVASATDVPVSGDVRVRFGRRPAGTPTLRLEPAHAVLESAHWDGNTLVAVYSGLHLSTRYQLVLQADYRSRLNDVGHLDKRWTLTTQGYPVLSAFTPAQDQKLAARVGKVSVVFSYRPPVEPRLTMVPDSGSLTAGGWYGMTWNAGYYGLKPLTRYEVTLTVDYGAAAASTQRQWAFTTEPAWPAPGVPVIWYATQPTWNPTGQRLLAVDWQGNLAGTLYPTSTFLQQAPDGLALLTPDGGYVDGKGAVPAATPAYASTAFAADDSQSVCKVVGSGPLWLETGPLRGATRRVAFVGSTGTRIGVDILACSVTNDRAVIADNGMGGTAAIRVFALSTGRLLYQRSYGGASVSLISSRDGRYVAEQTSTFDAQGQVATAFTIIRRTLDGRMVARLDNRRVLRFSWDGMRVVTVPVFAGTDVTLLDWQTGKVLWRQAGDPAMVGRPAFAMAQPSGMAMAIGVGGLDRSGQLDQLWIVAADGQATQVVNGLLYAAFTGAF
jgi:hypothetical protein